MWEYLAAVTCAWVGVLISSACAATAVMWLYCAFAPAAIQGNLVITGMYGLMALLFAGWLMAYQIRVIAQKVIGPWVVRTCLGMSPPTAFRTLKILCFLWLPLGVSMGICILGSALLVAHYLI